MPVWPHPHGEFRYCSSCGDVWRVARRGQRNPATGVYREGEVGERRTRCTCMAARSVRLETRLKALPDQAAAEAAWLVGGDVGVRALVPPQRRSRTADHRSWELRFGKKKGLY